jgi:wyosine [tRNA(Phe)-imidazoG37] synthetase (radical SAM superfamily)
MTPEMLEGLLRQLQDEGVQAIETIHFEGRGDPLLNPAMGELIKITKHLYPRAFTMATTHGSYRYFPWIVDSGLDLLRVSIDGAYADSYRKYRVGGDFERTLAFLKQVRDERERCGSHLRVMWKYILFEWNDSDDEIRHAAQLASELRAELNFVLTYSPGRSKRFPDKESLKRVKWVAPDAGFEITFQMKSPDDAPVESIENRRKVRLPIEWPRLDNLWLWCRRKVRLRTRMREAFATITRATTASRHDRA